jgi:hypothetical protein
MKAKDSRESGDSVKKTYVQVGHSHILAIDGNHYVHTPEMGATHPANQQEEA